MNIEIELLLVPVDNQLQKPGPVFLEMARAAYAAGADYFYRVNDDTEFLNPWATAFVAALQVGATSQPVRPGLPGADDDDTRDGEDDDDE